MSSPDKHTPGKLSKMAAKWPKHATGQPSKAASKIAKAGITKPKKSKLGIDKGMKRNVIQNIVKQAEKSEGHTIAARMESTKAKIKLSKIVPMEIECGKASKEPDVVENVGELEKKEENEEMIEEKVGQNLEKEVEEKADDVGKSYEKKVEEEIKEVGENIEKTVEEKIEDVGDINEKKTEEKIEEAGVNDKKQVDAIIIEDNVEEMAEEKEGITSVSSLGAEGVPSALFRDESREKVEDFTEVMETVMEPVEADEMGSGLEKSDENVETGRKTSTEVPEENTEGYKKAKYELLKEEKGEEEDKEAEKDKEDKEGHDKSGNEKEVTDTDKVEEGVEAVKDVEEKPTV